MGTDGSSTKYTDELNKDADKTKDTGHESGVKFIRTLRTKNSWKPYTIATCSAVLLYLVASNLKAILAGFGTFLHLLDPIIMGIVIAYLMTPLVKFVDKALSGNIRNDRARYYISIVLAAVLILILFGIVMSFLIPQLLSSVIQFINNINVYAEGVRVFMAGVSETLEHYSIDTSLVSGTISDLIDSMSGFVTNKAAAFINSSVSLSGNLVNLGIGIILAFYFLTGKSSLLKGFDRLFINTLSTAHYRWLTRFLSRCNRIFARFVVDDIKDAIIVGCINMVFMSIMNMPYAVLVSVVVGVTNLIPVFGPFIGAFIGAFILFFADTRFTIIFLIFTLLLQLCDGYVIKPKLFGNTVGLPGVWITMAIIAGGNFFGVTGILLAVPIAGITAFLYKDFIDARERRRLYASDGKGAAGLSDEDVKD